MDSQKAMELLITTVLAGAQIEACCKLWKHNAARASLAL